MKLMLISMPSKNQEPQGLADSLPDSAMDNRVFTIQQLVANKIKLEKMKLKTIVSIVLGLGLIIGSMVVTALVVSYWGVEPSTTPVFRIILHDKSTESDPIPLDITDDPENQLEYSRSPLEGDDVRSMEILGLKDFKKGIVAYKVENGSQCFIGRIATNSSMHPLANGTVQEADVEDTELYIYLNYTIHPFVLRLAAGDYIKDFCGDRDAVWMIPMDMYEANREDKDENKHGRVRRKCKGWGCEGISFKRCFWKCAWIDDRRKCTRHCVPRPR